jgi:hypothetical protein
MYHRERMIPAPGAFGSGHLFFYSSFAIKDQSKLRTVQLGIYPEMTFPSSTPDFTSRKTNDLDLI